jgi:hypothetical protein
VVPAPSTDQQQQQRKLVLPLSLRTHKREYYIKEVFQLATVDGDGRGVGLPSNGKDSRSTNYKNTLFWRSWTTFNAKIASLVPTVTSISPFLSEVFGPGSEYVKSSMLLLERAALLYIDYF